VIVMGNSDQRRFSDEEIRRELERVLVSPDFDASPRNKRFLAHVVEQVLVGRKELIKAYSIATAVFGRSDDFDPQMDPIVRIEAVRLRRSLERYYLLSGRDDPIKIDIRKGTYCPVFRHAESARSPAPSHEAPNPPSQRPSILVGHFEGDYRSDPSLSFGFSRRVVFALTRFSEIDVYSSEVPLGGDAGHAPKDEVDFILAGAVSAPDGQLRVNALLTDTRTGRHVWSESFETAVTSTGSCNARDDLAERVARAVGQPYGPLLLSREREAQDHPAFRTTASHCVVRFYRYLRSFDRTLHAEAWECLERAVREEPDHSEALACLAIIRVDAVRFGYGSGNEPDAIGQARALAARSVELAPHASRSDHALALALWFSGDVSGALEQYSMGLELNPNDTELMADFGLRLALQGKWDRSRMLLERAYAANPGLPSVFRTGLALEEFVAGRFAESLAQARRISAPTIVHGAVMRAVAAERLGLVDEAAAAVAQILALDPNYGHRTKADLTFRNVAPDVARAVIEGLGRAGLPGLERDATVARHQTSSRAAT
jgi:adenylate cyclase